MAYIEPASIETRSPVPARVLAAFDGRAHLTFPELAAAMEMDAKTLRRCCDAGQIDCLRKGTGGVRTHRVFTLAQVEAYYLRNQIRGGDACPSTSTGIRLAGNSISSARVIDFPGQQRSPSTDLKPKLRQRRPRRLKPPNGWSKT